MLSVIPKHWFSWDFVIHDGGGQTVGDVKVEANRERGTVTAGGTPRAVYRQGTFKGPWVLEEDGVVVARAAKPSALKKTLTIEYSGRTYTLKPRSAWGREMVLHEGDREVGSIAPEKMIVRRASVQLPEELPLQVKLFVVWLTMMLWKRSSDAAATSGAN
jgi:hypothetical protein